VEYSVIVAAETFDDAVNVRNLLSAQPRPARAPRLARALRPRVLYASKLYYPWQGGIEAVIRWHAEGLRDRFDTSVLACMPRGRARTDSVNGVLVRRAASLGMFLGMPVSPSYLLEFRKAARNADLVHLHLPFPPVDISQVLFGNRDIPVVATWHSDLVRQRAIMPVYGPFMRRFLDQVDRIIVPAQSVLERSQDLRGHLDKCVVVPLGITMPLKEPSFVSMPDVPDTERVVLFAGRLAYYKGLHHLVRAMRGVDAKLVIVGTGERERALKQLAREEGLAGQVIFKGRVSNEELDRWYRRCDVFVLPSTSPAETTGIVQLEAMARRKPVVNTALPTDVPEVSQHGVTGLTVEPGSPLALTKAINTLLADDGLRSWLGENGRLRVQERYTLGAMNRSVAEIYDELLGASAAEQQEPLIERLAA
jgi:rhamnosyl/mannosyltransferase